MTIDTTRDNLGNTGSGGNTDTSHGDSPQLTTEQLDGMSTEELARLGSRLDGVELAEYGPRYVPGSPADKNAERSVVKWFLLTGLFGVISAAAFIFWPNTYESVYSDKQWVYALYNPIIGVTLGLTVVFLGVGVVAPSRKIIPH